jgi:hypothetical protein
LSVCAIILLMTHTTGHTWGLEIAQTQLLPPHIYLLIFLVSLPGQFLFGVTPMTMSAVFGMFALGWVYRLATGSYFFFEMIPIAVFLGSQLLFTDPSTSPRTDAGRIVYGILYACGVFALAPAVGFYDKLLPVPVLNLAAPLLDRIPAPSFLSSPASAAPAMMPRPRRVAYLAVWVCAFTAMSMTHNLGHTSRGYWLPFWEQACADDRRHACEKLATLEETFCHDGDSGWACNDLGRLSAEGHYHRASEAPELFARACQDQFAPGCQNARLWAPDGASRVATGIPSAHDYAVLLMDGNGILELPPFDLFSRACGEGWMDACERVGVAYLDGDGVGRDPVHALSFFEEACQARQPTACASVAYQYTNGVGVERDDAMAGNFLRKACTLGMDAACRWAQGVESKRP